MAAFDGLLLLVLTWGALALAAWAFIDALVRPAAGFVAAGKLTKPGWLAITGLVSFPAATNPAAGRTSASMNAHAARARAPQVNTRSSNPSNAAIRGAYPPDCPETA